MKNPITFLGSTNLKILLLLFGFHALAFCQDVILTTQAEVDAFDQSKTVVEGNLVIDGIDIVDLSSLSSLETVGSDLLIQSTNILENLQGLHNLRKIGRTLKISSNDLLKNVDGLSSIDSIGSNVWFSSNYRLESINGLSNLIRIPGFLFVKSNSLLTSFDGLNNIVSVGGDLAFMSSAVQNLDPFINLLSVGGKLDIQENDNLENIDGLSNLSNFDGSVSIRWNPVLQNIDGLLGIDSILVLDFEKLDIIKHIDGLLNVKSIADIRIRYNDDLENISGLINASNLGRHNLTIEGLDRIVNLHGLENITEARTLIIRHNDNLKEISALANIDFDGNLFWITHNPRLDDCCAIKEIIRQHHSDPITNFDIRSNATNCKSVENIQVDNCRNILKGSVFFDANQNGIKDSTDFGIPDMTVLSLRDSEKSKTNFVGQFGRQSQEGTLYTMELALENLWELTTSSPTYEFIFDPENHPDIEFGLFYPDPICLAELAITSERTRCNTEVTYHISVSNKGLTSSTGQVKVKLDEKLSFVSSSVEMVEENGHFVHQFEMLNPFELIEFTMILEMPSEQATGETISVEGEVYYDEQEGLTLKDEVICESIVLCSYDPNDKQVSPVGIKDEHYNLIGDELNYTVRFQNTGNAAAIDVKILDTLSEFLDLESFKVTQSSFPAFTTLKGNAVEFYFQDIWLIDSITNEPESHGFISYSIKPKANIPELTEIQNTAHIIFDFNPAIVTNTTRNTMVETICPDQFVTEVVTICEGEVFMGYSETGNFDLEFPIGITCDSFVMLELTVLPMDDPQCTVFATDEQSLVVEIFPNPTTNVLYIKSKAPLRSQLLDMSGKVLVQTIDAQLDLSRLTRGVYILSITNGNHSEVHRIVKL